MPSNEEYLKVWDIFSPCRVVFGCGCLSAIGRVSEPFGNKAMLITAPALSEMECVRKTEEILCKRGCYVEINDTVDSEPTVDHVNQIVSRFCAEGFDFMVAVGGGSVLDAAKAAAVVAKQGGHAESYLAGERKLTNASASLIAVPTTAGTGAEMSKGAIISWPEKHLKVGIRGEAVFANAVIVDPLLTETAPVEISTITGFDVFTHAVETYISKKSNLLTSLFSREAITNVCYSLPAILKDPTNIEARTSMSFFSMLMGFNLAHSSTCLPHRMQYPLGIMTRTPHALGLAALYPAWFRVTRESSRRKFEEVGVLIKSGLESFLQHSLEGDESELLGIFMNTIKLEPTLRDLGVDEKMCGEFVGSLHGGLDNDPWWRPDADLVELYYLALDRES